MNKIEQHDNGVQTQQDAHWYAVDRHGIATLCLSEEDARDTAAEADQSYPNNAPHVATQLVPANHQAQQDAKDAARLDWLDQTNARFRMGWRVGLAPAGNVSIGSVIQLGGEPTSIRNAIDAARKGEGGAA